MTTNRNMVKILAKGFDFQMGQPDPDITGEGVTSGEQAVHTVSFTYDFWMDTTEVTQKEFDSLMRVTYDNYLNPAWDATHGNGENYPAYNVSWGDAALFCNARSKSDGYDTVYTYSSVNGAPGSLCELIERKYLRYQKTGIVCLLKQSGNTRIMAEMQMIFSGGKTSTLTL